MLCGFFLFASHLTTVAILILLMNPTSTICMYLTFLLGVFILQFFPVTENGYRLRKAARFIKNTYSNEGVLTLWRGNSATMARVMPFAAIQFSTYEKYKILLRPAGSVER